MAGRTASAIDQRVGARINALRTELGLSQPAFAKVIGVTFQQLQKYEGGKNRTAASTLQVMADAFDVPVSRFFDAPQADRAEVHA